MLTRRGLLGLLGRLLGAATLALAERVCPAAIVPPRVVPEPTSDWEIDWDDDNAQWLYPRGDALRHIEELQRRFEEAIFYGPGPRSRAEAFTGVEVNLTYEKALAPGPMRNSNLVWGLAPEPTRDEALELLKRLLNAPDGKVRVRMPHNKPRRWWQLL